MPNITTAGTFTKDSTGFAFLSYKDPDSGEAYERVLAFSGTTLGTGCSIQFTDDTGTKHTIPSGSISELPTWLRIAPVNFDLQIVVTGTPNFNVTPGL